jgi:transposase-like protein
MFADINKKFKMGKVPKNPRVVATPGSRPMKTGTGGSGKKSGGKKTAAGSSGKEGGKKGGVGGSGKKAGVGSSGKKAAAGSSGKKAAAGSSGSSGGGSSSSVGTPKSRNRKRKGTSRKDNYRTKYVMEDMNEAVRLVREEGYSVAGAAEQLKVPRMTLTDRLKKYSDPTKAPKVGRPQELSAEVEKAIVDCLCLCAEFKYPMRKRDLQKLVQSYVQENSVLVRWVDGKPGKDWIRNFQKRWKHRVVVKKPTNIKRSRAQISPKIIRDFFSHLEVTLQGVEPAHFFNYDESNVKDDPGRYRSNIIEYGRKKHRQYVIIITVTVL